MDCMNERAKSRKKPVVDGEGAGRGGGAGSNGSFKCNTAGKWSLYQTLAIADDPRSTKACKYSDHKEAISSPIP
jgi:hypothetical protein